MESITVEAAPAPIPSPSPLEASSTVRGWPENYSNPAGLYSWTPGGPDQDEQRPWRRSGWTTSMMLTLTRASVRVYRLCRFAEYVRSKDGIDGPYSDVPTMVSDEQGPEWRGQLWYVDGGEMRLFVRLQSYPDIGPADLAEAEAVVESIRPEPLGTGDGYRFVFELPDGWGSG